QEVYVDAHTRRDAFTYDSLSNYERPANGRGATIGGKQYLEHSRPHNEAVTDNIRDAKEVDADGHNMKHPHADDNGGLHHNSPNDGGAKWDKPRTMDKHTA
ncbi:hypothetical protein PUR49_06925, partial [Streptomyces sp. BE147]|uniref:hypothetical protein n=1 Tax=Streptomyces sp. BE147 TaxID=3002524 RepID=UPI002E77FFBF